MLYIYIFVLFTIGIAVAIFYIQKTGKESQFVAIDQTLTTEHLLKKVRKMEIKTKGLSKHIFSGDYQSAFKGRGMSFSEVRNYIYGDDVRNIDWNVTARTNETAVKVFEEERELTVILMVDVSGSSFFGTNGRFKSDLITEISSVIAFSASSNNDKVGAILFADGVVKYLAPKKGKQPILRLIRELLAIDKTNQSTNLSTALEYLNNIQKKRAIVFCLSDFMDKDFESALTVASRRHDIIGMHIYDTAEKTLPSAGLLNVLDPETGAQRTVDTSSSQVRDRYEASFKDHQDYVNTTFMKNGCDIVSISTDDDYVKKLLQFFKSKGR